MKTLYLILLGIAGLILLFDAFYGETHSPTRGGRLTVRLLPLALFFVVLVWFIQIAHTL